MDISHCCWSELYMGIKVVKLTYMNSTVNNILEVVESMRQMWNV